MLTQNIHGPPPADSQENDADIFESFGVIFNHGPFFLARKTARASVISIPIEKQHANIHTKKKKKPSGDKTMRNQHGDRGQPTRRKSSVT